MYLCQYKLEPKIIFSSALSALSLSSRELPTKCHEDLPCEFVKTLHFGYIYRSGRQFQALPPDSEL
jgi:hypothetical protein